MRTMRGAVRMWRVVQFAPAGRGRCWRWARGMRVAGRARMIELFGRLARATSTALGHPLAFAAATLSIIAWALTGPAFRYSATWQLVVNTGTTILTFLMLFLVQNTQNRDARAMHLKLDELLRALKGARNEMIDLENLTEAEIERYCGEFRELHARYDAELSRRRGAVPDREHTGVDGS